MTDQTPDFTSPQVISFTVGVYLGVNAVRDAFLLVDGPDCVLMRTQYLQGNHDYLSHLNNVSGFHKISNTGLTPTQVVHDREEVLVETLRDMASREEVGCVGITSLPVATVLGIDYDRLCRRARGDQRKPVIHIPGRSLSTDWLGGYAEFNQALARGISLDDPSPRQDAVAIVGYLHDRNEEDSAGNIRELKRLLEGLGLELVSVWLSGDDLADYEAVQQAGAIISMPYARRAARTLSRRLGVPLIETELPLGIKATERWLRQLGEQFGAQAAAEQLIERELTRLIPRLERVIPFLFEGKVFALVGDPFMLTGLVETFELYGAETRWAMVTNFAYHMRGVELGDRVANVSVEPTTKTVIDFLASDEDRAAVDCVVATSNLLASDLRETCAVVELGFPSNNEHALYDRPYLGFMGALAFTDTVANRMRAFLAQSNPAIVRNG